MQVQGEWKMGKSGFSSYILIISRKWSLFGHVSMKKTSMFSWSASAERSASATARLGGAHGIAAAGGCASRLVKGYKGNI